MDKKENQTKIAAGDVRVSIEADGWEVRMWIQLDDDDDETRTQVACRRRVAEHATIEILAYGHTAELALETARVAAVSAGLASPPWAIIGDMGRIADAQAEQRTIAVHGVVKSLGDAVELAK